MWKGVINRGNNDYFLRQNTYFTFYSLDIILMYILQNYFYKLNFYMKNVFFGNTNLICIRLITFFLLFSMSTQAQKEVNIAKQHLFENTKTENITRSDIETMNISSQYLSPTTGWYHIYFNQTNQSVEVYNAVLAVTLKNDKVEWVANSFVKALDAKITSANSTNALSAKDAVQKATAFLKMNRSNNEQLKEISATKLANGKIGKVIFEDKSISNENIEAKLYWLPYENTAGEKLVSSIALTWNVRIVTKDGKNSWSVHVDANTGNILQKIDEVIHCDFGVPNHAHNTGICTEINTIQNELPSSPTANGYNVFDYPLESPIHGSRTIVTNPYTRFLPATMGPGTTNGWHNDGTTDYTNTRGNNVWAKDDIANDNETTIGSNPSSATLDFNYPYTLGTATAAANLNAAITNLFYWNNVIHDVLWRYGFDEPSGNFQKDNLGKGGLGNDFVQADAQDGSGTSNANFSTPIDGSNGRMQMYIWANVGSPLYQPDSDFDNGVIAHEYGHGWSIRLTGGPANSSCLQNAEQGGEGWGDYNALMLTTNWASLTPTIASANIPRGIGTYVLGQTTSGAGIRPYRYSYDKVNINNVVTYGKVADATNFSQPHGIGSIWATMLWDMTWEIILQDNFIAPNIYDVPTTVANMRGNIAAYKLVTEGLRLQACSPSFVQARDAIFQADLSLFGGRYRCAIGRAFARRGLGLNASTGTSSNDRVVTEDFTNFSAPSLNSATSNVVCSKQAFVYTATTAAVGTYTFNWTRAVVAGISNAAGSGSSANINEVLLNTTSSPIAVTYLFYITPNNCGGAPDPQPITVLVNPAITPIVNTYNICQNGIVPSGQGLVAPSLASNNVNGIITVGTTYIRGTGNNTTLYTAATTSGTSVYYKTYTFVAPTTTAVTLSTTAATLTPGTVDDTYMSLYQTSFTPSTPAVNFLIGDDDSGAGFLSSFTRNLVAGTTYVIVVSTYSNTVTGSFSLQSSANIFLGTNNWYLNAAGGTPLATGEVFNPVGVAGSGITNTATVGSSTFYVANAQYPDCRSLVTFIIRPTILYVNANASGTNDGSSWANAFTTLQPAIASAASCTGSQVWVAAGTYKPTVTLDRTVSFSMRNGLAIYGGFPNSGNPIFSQRNPTKNFTILSGDIGAAGNADNSYHVISNTAGIDNTAILDGFVIADGNANTAGSFRNVGGGLFNNAGAALDKCSPKIDNCIFTNNNALDNGGAVYNNAINGTSNPTFSNCIFNNNTAANGGALYSDGTAAGTASPVFTNCTFANNSAGTDGAVAYNFCSTGTCLPTFTNCIFWNNGGVKTFLNNNANTSVKYSLLEPSVINYTNVAGNISSNVSPFILPMDFHLKESSNAIDAGTATGAPTTDVDFITRSSIPDMGAYENVQACVGSNKDYTTDVLGTAYQWQKNDGNGYVNITDGSLYNNVTTSKLTIINPATITTGTKFRCMVTSGGITYSAENTIRFYNRWQGTIDNNWLNPANWSCGSLPDQYVDVIVPSAKTIYPLVNVSGSIRTLQTETGSSVTVATGGSLIVVGQ